MHEVLVFAEQFPQKSGDLGNKLKYAPVYFEKTVRKKLCVTVCQDNQAVFMLPFWKEIPAFWAVRDPVQRIIYLFLL